ncbi:MAG: hypothetical protein D8M52_03930 [Chlorobi bacterium]|nr:MAG: hypothetical protein F9K28_05345 [Bacteroidota bacterium]KXK34545.1 MAG: hypothetical protein UZ06_CHB003001008 [Chlorobi bacterium OLB6]MBE2265669.1 hypothetical protein [Flavobacteriales bacterium]MBL1160851.1 hypothetical protein [Chlorobiota bacterium]MBW7852811.1 hypothetical protein [Candidatus Kapabacteria bacterium]MCC6330958.1 hypothetical protein [Ignavibacteria bacterium]
MTTKKYSNLYLIVALTGLLLFTGGCATGPNGPDPGQELDVKYTVGSLGIPELLDKSADAIWSGDVIRMTNVAFMADSLVNNEARFDESVISPYDDPDVIIRFKDGIPTKPGTYQWEATTINYVNAFFNMGVTQGAIIRQNGQQYFPVEGTTVLTEVRLNDDGTIQGISGYCTGKVRTLWPMAFKPSVSEPVPSGFDLNNPTLAGDYLTIHSCIFNSRVISRGTPRK